MLKRNLVKGQRGIILSDAVIAILIILLFAGIMTTLIVNIVLESAKIKMNSQQIDFATEILEYIEILPYENVTEENIINYVNNKNLDYVSAGETIDEVQNTEAAYKIGIQVETYTPDDPNLPRLNIIKKITLTIQNNLNDKPYSTEISRIKKATMSEVEILLQQQETGNFM